MAGAEAGRPERWTAHRLTRGPSRTTRTLDSPQTPPKAQTGQPERWTAPKRAGRPDRTTRTRTVAEAG
ncbi:hypothetical protein DXT66_21715 [Nocardia farcinica]|nr:hypothetical protein DXT66_21715 [Nocardia farcinica]